MKYRKEDESGDMMFGHGDRSFYKDVPEGVAQAVKTRLLLWSGEWFLDSGEGTPYTPGVSGNAAKQNYDVAIRLRMLQTPGVLEVTDFESLCGDRTLSVSATIDTKYGRAEYRV